MSICAYCGDTVLWVTTAKGKKMPVNPGLVDYWAKRGGKSKIVTPRGDVVSGEMMGEGPATGQGYTSHFATCPMADLARRKPT